MSTTDLDLNFLFYRLAREAIKRVLPRPPEDREGFNVVFITSGAGINAFTTPLTYGSSKAMLNHVTKELGKLLGKDGIRVNAVSPGMTVFPGSLWEKIVAANPNTGRTRQAACRCSACQACRDRRRGDLWPASAPASPTTITPPITVSEILRAAGAPPTGAPRQRVAWRNTPSRMRRVDRGPLFRRHQTRQPGPTLFPF
jgi:NAD(P)-dependent dehydrogenase (short-subunit alcohol dehydrogenase family)